MNALSCTLALATLATTASAQSEVFGVDVRLGNSFTSTTTNFVNDWTQLSTEARALYGLDFNAAGDTLYAIDDASLEVVTIDTVTGVSTANGAFLSGPTGLTGLTAAADGTTWYLSDFDGVDSNLFVGDVVTGAFTFVGVCQAGGIMIDISIDANDNLYGFSISDDSLYSIDTTTGAGTVIGPVGLNGNFAQGMDFDPASGLLYASIYTGGGTGKWCTLDLVTGVATQLEDTLVLNSEMIVAIRPAAVPSIGTSYCMANANSTGLAAGMSASGSGVAADNNLTITAEQLPLNAFGFFLVSSMQGFVMNPGGSSGNLCLGGAVGRYVGPGQIKNSGAGGTFSLLLNLTQLPTPTGFVSVSAGDTYNFQTWYRDALPSGPTSNFSSGYEIVFQ